MKKLIFIFGVFMTSLFAKPSIVIVLGPPGAGKGTHSIEIEKKLNIPKISTGDLFRENIRNNTILGKKAKDFTEKGVLVPDEIVEGMLFERIQQDDCKGGFILDGFPRTLNQAKSLKNHIKDRYRFIVLNLKIDDEKLIERITGRLICKKCDIPYHEKFLPPKEEDLCDVCKEKLLKRKDDTEKVVKERLKEYHEKTELVVDFYKKGNASSFYEVDASKKKEEVFKNILSFIKK